MKTRLYRTPDKEQADQPIKPTVGAPNPLSASKLTLPHHVSGRAESTIRGFLVFLSDMFSPSIPCEHESRPADPWFEYLVDHAQVVAETRACYATWNGLLRVEQPDRETEATDLHDMVRTLVQAREEIMGVLERDVKRQTHVIRALLRAEHLDMGDAPAKQAVGS